MLLHVPSRTRRRRATPRQRACVAVAVAVVIGWCALSVAARTMTSSHYLCELAVGGDAGDGRWLCPDGTAYAWPLLLAFLGLSFENRRWSESDHPWSSGSDDDDD